MRVAFLGPEGTFTEEALRASVRGSVEELPYPTVREAVMAVQDGDAERAVVPIENALEGSVRATLDTLAAEAPDVRIEAQVTHPIRHCLIARRELELAQIEVVISHPQASAQCARFIRVELPEAQVRAAPSTADAVREVAGEDRPWAALGGAAAARIYNCMVLREGVEDDADNVTRFVWLAPGPPHGAASPGDSPQRPADVATKTSIVFWGFDDYSPGALVGVLSELAQRGVNLSKIESRPRRVRLGHYMFFADLEGARDDPPVRDALAALGARVETLKVLGSYAADATLADDRGG